MINRIMRHHARRFVIVVATYIQVAVEAWEVAALNFNP
jgi:hypothetical protein